MKARNLFLISWRKTAIALLIFIVCFFFRNVVIETTGLDRAAVLFIAQVLIPLYLIIALLYSYSQGKRLNLSYGKKKIFLLSWKRFVLLLLIWIAAVVLHNLIYALFIVLSETGIWVMAEIPDEPVFFIIANVIIPIYFIIALIYSFIYKIKKKK